MNEWVNKYWEARVKKCLGLPDPGKWNLLNNTHIKKFEINLNYCLGKVVSS